MKLPELPDLSILDKVNFKEKTPEDEKLCAEILKKYNQYVKSGDVKGAINYLNHMKNELRKSNK